jgi:hypothetical protein
MPSWPVFVTFALYHPVPLRHYTGPLHNWLIPTTPTAIREVPVSERLIDSLKIQVMYAATQEQAREAVEMLAAFGYRAKPALSDLEPIRKVVQVC